jgi:dephospho-CoA kinase
VIRALLTGGIATGKSHVLRAFARLGVPTIDADTLAHESLAAGRPGASAVIARFGTGVRLPDGSINRRALGAIVFKDADARRDLEAIVHPAIYDAIARWFSSLPAGTPYAIADIPLLFETNHQGDGDQVVVAACPPEEQLRRLMARDGLSEVDARARIAAQLPLESKIERADYVVWTTGTTEETERQVRDIVERA